MLPIHLLATASAASFARIPDLAELAERSSAVVEGVVEEATAQPTPYGLSTRYRIVVEATLAGADRPEVVIELPGGRRDGLVQTFSGVPVWSVGDEVLVFVPRPGQAQPLTGVFTRSGDALVDPIERPDPVTSVADVSRWLEIGHVGAADDEPVFGKGRPDLGTSDDL